MAVIGACRAVTLVYLTPQGGVANLVVSRPQASVGNTGQSIILIHVGCQSQIRGGLWHYKRLWLKFIVGLFHVQGSYQVLVSSQIKPDTTLDISFGAADAYAMSL